MAIFPFFLRAQVFVEKQQIAKNEITVFLFSLHGSCLKSEKNVPQKLYVVLSDSPR